MPAQVPPSATTLSRRQFLATAAELALLAGGTSLTPSLAAAEPPSSPKSLSRELFSASETELAFGLHQDTQVDRAQNAIVLAPALDPSRQRDGHYTSRVIDIPRGVELELSWRNRWNTPLTWEKLPANPVLQRGSEDAWDSAGVALPSVIQTERHWRLYYGSRPNGIGMAEAPLTQPHRWEKHPKPVLVAGTANAFDAAGVNAPEVVKVTDRLWRMYYVGYDPVAQEKGARVHQIGLAESEDAGRTWKRYSDQPVIPRGATGSYDAFSTSSASVLRVGNTWMMWYGGIAQVPYRIGICVATSSDGRSWHKHPRNPVLPHDPSVLHEAAIVAKPHVIREDGIFKMWYSAQGDGADAHYQIGYAESKDGITWERCANNPVVRPSTHGWDSHMVEYADVVRDGTGYHLWYSGNDFDSVGYAFGKPATRVVMRVRSGPSSKPDHTWSDWSAPCLSAEGTRLQPTTARFLQFRCELEATPAHPSPAVQDIVLRHPA